MRKKNFFFLALAATAMMAMSSCTNNDDLTAENAAPQSHDMFFTVNHENPTRGTATTLSNFEVTDNTFMVFGYYSTTATGSGVTAGGRYVGTSDILGTVIKYDGTKWDYNSPADKKLWPVATAPLNFQAVSPTDAGTIINTPADNVAKLGMTITVPAGNSAQKDVIFGHAEGLTFDANGAVVPLTFEHALSQVLFQAKCNEAGMTAVINGVKVCNAKSTANIGYLGDLTDDRRALAVENIGAAADKYAIGLVGGAAVTVPGTTAADLCATDGVLLMIPQSGADAWSVATDGSSISDADDAKQTYLEVECKLYYTDSNEYIFGDASTFKKVYIPFTIDWNIGKKYTYVLNFGSGAGGYDEDGNQQMNYISYSVGSVGNWEPVSGGTVDF